MSVVAKLKYSPARTSVWKASPPKSSRNSERPGSTTKNPNATPATNSDDTPATISSIRRRDWSCTAGITNAYSWYSHTGSESRIAAQKQTFSVVKKGSVGDRVMSPLVLEPLRQRLLEQVDELLVERVSDGERDDQRERPRR